MKVITDSLKLSCSLEIMLTGKLAKVFFLGKKVPFNNHNTLMFGSTISIAT